ncbi:MAG: RebB family R body protein [Rhizomicrobium sp.]
MAEPTTDSAPDSAEPDEAPFAQAEQADTARPAQGEGTLNTQITDALAAANAAARDTTTAALAQVIAQAAGLALLNAVNAQQNAYVAANATVLATVNRILGAGALRAEKGADV